MCGALTWRASEAQRVARSTPQPQLLLSVAALLRTPGAHAHAAACGAHSSGGCLHADNPWHACAALRCALSVAVSHAPRACVTAAAPIRCPAMQLRAAPLRQRRDAVLDAARAG